MTYTKQTRPEQIKHIGGGKISVRWTGETDFQVIDDVEISTYLVFLMLQGDGYTHPFKRVL